MLPFPEIITASTLNPVSSLKYLDSAARIRVQVGHDAWKLTGPVKPHFSGKCQGSGQPASWDASGNFMQPAPTGTEDQSPLMRGLHG